MPHPSKRKGDAFELEVQAWLRDNLGVPARRALGAGRKDDIGDITGVPGTVIQCANWKDVAQAVRHKPVECEEQRERADALYGDSSLSLDAVPFAATFIRLRGGDMRVVLTPAQFAALWREATA